METEWAAHTFSPVELYDIRTTETTSLDIPLLDGDNAMLLVISWSVTVAWKKLEREDMAYFSLQGDIVSMDITEPATLLFMAGTPLDEPVVSYGPFVMNTQMEIMQAFADLNAGKMGVEPDNNR